MRIKDIQFLQSGGVTWSKLSVPQRRKYIADFLSKKGYNKIQANAIIGNLEQENSKFDPSYMADAGDYGIAQWAHPSRKNPLMSLKNHDTIDVQLDYLHKEIQGNTAWMNRKGGKDAFMKATKLEKATEIFSRDFENPHKDYENLANRIKYAYNSAGLDYSKVDLSGYTGGEYGSASSVNLPEMPSANYDIQGFNANDLLQVPKMVSSGLDQVNQNIHNLMYQQYEYNNQKEIKEREEKELQAVQNEFKRRQAEREQFLSMIPQVADVESVNSIGVPILPQQDKRINPSDYEVQQNSFVMQEGGEIDNYDETDDYSEEYNLSGGQDKALNSFPIYKDTTDFINRNKDLTTYKPKYENGKLTYSSEPLYVKRGYDYKLNNINSDIYDDNSAVVVHGEQCMASSCRAIDGLVGSGASYLQSSDETRKLFGINGSTASKPTDEEIANNPMYFDDIKFGSADAWDYAYMAGQNSPKNVIFDAGKGERTMDIDSFKNNSKSYNDIIKDYNIPIGSFITLGYRVVDNDSTKVKGSSHTVRVVGYDDNGQILVSDMDEVKPLSNAMYIGGNLDAKVISSIITIPGKEKYTFDYFKNLQTKAKTKSSEKYVDYKGKMPVLNDDGDIEYIKPSSEYKKYAKTISESKNYITAMLGIEDSEYDRYAKMALTMPALETNYGEGFMYKTGIDGDSTGLSQIVKENVQPKYKNILSKYKENSPQHDALATILYMKELDGYRDKWVEQSKSETERPYYLQDHSISGLMKDTARLAQGRSKGGFYKGILDYKYKVDEDDIDIPSRKIIGEESDEEYASKVNEVLKNNPNLRFEMVDRGGDKKRPTIYKKTKGNTIPEELEHMVGYLWQSPNSVKYGDAQGDNQYYKKYRKIYETLFNK